MSTQVYKDGEVTVRVRGLEGGGSVRLHIEHKSGAALIVPDCTRTRHEHGTRFQTRGFDGTTFTLELDDAGLSLDVHSSQQTDILGGLRQRTLARVRDLEVRPQGLRITGDEVTRPLSVIKPEE